MHSLVCAGFFAGWFLIQFAMLAFPGAATSSGAFAAWPLFIILFVLPYSLFSRAFYQKRTGLMPFGTIKLSNLWLPIISMVILSVATMFYGENETWLMQIFNLSPLHQFIMVVAVIFAGPVIEEIIFRGFLLNAGMGYGPNGKRVAIFITSLLFALAHYQYHSPVTFIMIFVMSVIFCLVRIHTNSLLGPIILHALYNGIQMLLLFTLMSVS
ncbi:CPBP family intramembrane glutamic endopeptidase [Morganella morganii]|uniref:CPBP family intramembrane glutamic endopeptidase n=1 Tax=Morganella morganii TaxID=582 RepID=UPI0006883FAE|nr:type II CAAX endopeptidase family protein [Morganella morganii]